MHNSCNYSLTLTFLRFARNAAPEALNLSHLLAALAPRFADSFSLLGPIARVCKILTNEMDLAAQLLQWRHKVRRLKRELYSIKKDIPRDRWIRKVRNW